MANLRAIDMLLVEEIFEMGSGYVLNFSDRTYHEFFATELEVDIGIPLYSKNGTSKAKRLRCFLQTVEKPLVVRTLKALWEYRESLLLRTDRADGMKNAGDRFRALINRLEGKPEATVTVPTSSVRTFDHLKIGQLKADILSIGSLEAHQRGYAFERFLKEFFDVYGLAAREPFRLRGEQIDGSFQLGSETYLVEAKWHSEAMGVAELHTFHGKIEQKAAWTRGLFVSYTGFTQDGLLAFGRGKRAICMDGLDLYETLDRQIPLDTVLEQKVRRAAETGSPFVRVRDLFP